MSAGRHLASPVGWAYRKAKMNPSLRTILSIAVALDMPAQLVRDVEQ